MALERQMKCIRVIGWTMTISMICIFARRLLFESDPCPVLADACEEIGMAGQSLGCERGNVNYFVLRGVPAVGDPWGWFMVAVVLNIVLLTCYQRFDSRQPFHIWVAWYAVAVNVQAMSAAVLQPLIIDVCPTNALALMHVAQAGVNAGYLASQIFLGFLAVLRLRLVASEASAARATLILRMLVLLVPILAVVRVMHLPRVWMAVTVSALAVYAAFQAQTLVTFWTAAQQAWREAKLRETTAQERAAARRVAITAAASAASASTTILWGVVLCFVGPKTTTLAEWMFQGSILLDMPSDAGLALVCAGLLGPASDKEEELRFVHKLSTQNRVRHIMEQVTAARLSVCGPAVVLGALFDGEEPDGLIANSVARFRCITWSVLSTRPDVIMGDGPLDGAADISTNLYALSEPCEIGDCDAFVSHSWRDDSTSKWESLQWWCEEFHESHKRSPRLWLDKVCVDQSNIQTDLACLPVFLAACNTMLIISGPTYTERLWCCVELYVFFQISTHDEPDCALSHKIIVPGADENEAALVRQKWKDFDASECNCFKDCDKERIFNVINRFPGGIPKFNEHVKDIASKIWPCKHTTAEP